MITRLLSELQPRYRDLSLQQLLLLLDAEGLPLPPCKEHTRAGLTATLLKKQPNAASAYDGQAINVHIEDGHWEGKGTNAKVVCLTLLPRDIVDREEGHCNVHQYMVGLPEQLQACIAIAYTSAKHQLITSKCMHLQSKQYHCSAACLPRKVLMLIMLVMLHFDPLSLLVVSAMHCYKDAHDYSIGVL